LSCESSDSESDCEGNKDNKSKKRSSLRKRSSGDIKFARSTKLLDDINKLPNSLKIQLNYIRKVALLNYTKESKLIKLSKEKIAELFFKGLPKYHIDPEIGDDI
jgi:hypothetical protein